VRTDIGPATWDPNEYHPVDFLLDHRWVLMKVKGKTRNNGTRKKGTVRRVLQFLVRWEAPWQDPSNDTWEKAGDIRSKCKEEYWGREVDEFPPKQQLSVVICSNETRYVTDGGDSDSNITNAITDDGGCQTNTNRKTTYGGADGGSSGWKATENNFKRR